MENTITNKIKTIGVPLRNWHINIYRGILTGFNDAFIIDTNKKNQLIEEDPKSAEIIRPILRGRDISRYSYNFAELWLINVHNGIKSQNIDPICIDKYPAIKRHLDKYYHDLTVRADKGDTAYNLRNCVYLDDFSKQKIIWKRIGSKIRFCYDCNAMLCLDSTCFATGNHIKYLAAILNTYVGNFLFKDSPKTGTGDLLISVQAFDPICVPIPTEKQERTVNDLLDKLLLCSDLTSVEKLDEELNDYVADIYGFDEREKDYIKTYAKKHFR